MKFNKSDDQTNSDKINLPKFIEKRQLFHVTNFCEKSKINKFKWTYGLFGHNYRVATLSTFHLTVLGIIKLILKF